MRKSSKLLNVCAVCLLSMLVLSMLGADEASAKWKNYSFKNYSGRTIKNLYISRSGYDKWGNDMCGSSVLSHGESLNMRYDNKYHYFDIKVVWMDNTHSTWSKYNFRSMWRLTLYRDGSVYRISKN